MSQQPLPQPAKSIARGPGSLLAGTTYPFKALWLLLKTPKLRRYILIPILLNAVIGVTLYAGLLFAGMRAIDSVLANLPIWTATLSHEAAALSAPLSNTSQTLSTWLPHWNLQLPHWQIGIPAGLPQWNISLPHWNIQLPDWFSQWNIQLPNIQLPGWVRQLPEWGWAIFVGILRVLLTVLLLLVTGLILLQFGVLLGAPWYGKLSEEIERLKTGQIFLIELNPVQDIGRAIAYELKKLVLSLGIGLPLLLANFFPGVGTLISTIVGIALGSTIVCMDFLDAAVERRRPSFRTKLGIVFRSLPASGSFGLICLGLVSIPLLNLLAIPVCVTAGTLFFCDRVLPWFPPPSPKS